MIENSSTLRSIIHCDMDAFYASVEQLKNPALEGKPVVVGGSPQSRGVVSACSYEARQFGIHSAMPLAHAQRLCPQAVFLPVDFPKYRELSRKMHRIFYDYTPMIEPISLDEAFLDVTGSKPLFGTPQEIGRQIKQRVRDELGLTVSVGVAHNKFLAKLGSDYGKPDGFVVIAPDKVQEFLDPLDVSRIWGVGAKTAQRLYDLNIKTVKDLCILDESYLVRLFGSFGHQLFCLARGIDNRPVETGRQVKSIGRETTFATDVAKLDQLERTILELAADVGRSLRKQGLKGRTVTLKIKYHDFKSVTRSATLDILTNIDETIYSEACRLLHGVTVKPIRLVGVSVHNLTGEEKGQLSLFGESQKDKEKLFKAIDSVKDRFGDKSITMARLLERKE